MRKVNKRHTAMACTATGGATAVIFSASRLSRREKCLLYSLFVSLLLSTGPRFQSKLAFYALFELEQTATVKK